MWNKEALYADFIMSNLLRILFSEYNKYRGILPTKITPRQMPSTNNKAYSEQASFVSFP